MADFAGGRLGLVAVRAYYGGPLVGNALATLKEHMPNIDTRVAAIFRQDDLFVAGPPLSKRMVKSSLFARSYSCGDVRTSSGWKSPYPPDHEVIRWQ